MEANAYGVSRCNAGASKMNMHSVHLCLGGHHLFIVSADYLIERDKDTNPLAYTHMSFRAHTKQKVWIATYAQQIFQCMSEVSSRDLLEQVAKRRLHLFESNNRVSVQLKAVERFRAWPAENMNMGGTDWIVRYPEDHMLGRYIRHTWFIH